MTTPDTFAEFHARLGGVALDRIWMKPPPGMATEQHVLDARDGPIKRLVELVDAKRIMRTGTPKHIPLFGHVVECAYIGEPCLPVHAERN